MNEKLKELAMRLQQGKTSQNTPQQTSQKIEEEEDENYEDEEDEEVSVIEKQKLKKETPRELSKEEEIAMEIELLQNDGRYRVELLHRLDEMNRSMKVLAGVLVELTSDEIDKKG